MKKLILFFALIVGFFSYGQNTVSKSVSLLPITTATRDGLNVTGRYPIIYNSTTGQFERYNGSSWEILGGAETNDLTSAVTWANVPDANITSSSVAQHIDTFAELNTIVADATLLKSGDNISTLTNDSGYITSQTDDQIASEVNITDAGADYTGTTVEAALGEIADSLAVKVNIDPLSRVSPIDVYIGTEAQYAIDYPSGAGAGTLVFTSDGTLAANRVDYTNTTSGLTATDVQAAIDEVEARVDVNDAKVSNATHTGEITGSTSLAADPTLISNKTLVTAASGDMVLVQDATDSQLKKVNASDFLSGGGLSDGDKGDITVSSGGTVWDIDPSTVGTTEITDASIDEVDLDASVNASLDLADTSVQPTTANTYTAGAKQTMQASATTAGFNLAGVTADPSALSNGDLWIRSTAGDLVYRENGVSRTVVAATKSQTLTNKTLTSPAINTQISGTVTSGGNITTTNYLVGATATQTLTNKTIALGSNTISGSTAEFNAALTDGSFATGGGTATGTNTGDQTITLTGDVTGSGTGSFATSLSAGSVGSNEIASEAITGQTTVTAASGDFILISDTSDSGNTKKVDAADFLGGGGSNSIQEVTITITNPTISGGRYEQNLIAAQGVGTIIHLHSIIIYASGISSSNNTTVDLNLTGSNTDFGGGTFMLGGTGSGFRIFTPDQYLNGDFENTGWDIALINGTDQTMTGTFTVHAIYTVISGI